MRLSAIVPGGIKCHTILSGNKGDVGAHERYDFVDGTYMEFEKTENKQTMNKWKFSFINRKTDVPLFMDMPAGSEITDTFRVKPITYSGCPFTQAIADRQAKLLNEPGIAQQKIFVEWKTKCSKPLSQEQLDGLRAWKFGLINDFDQNLLGNQKTLQI